MGGYNNDNKLVHKDDELVYECDNEFEEFYDEEYTEDDELGKFMKSVGIKRSRRFLK